MNSFVEVLEGNSEFILLIIALATVVVPFSRYLVKCYNLNKAKKVFKKNTVSMMEFHVRTMSSDEEKSGTPISLLEHSYRDILSFKKIYDTFVHSYGVFLSENDGYFVAKSFAVLEFSETVPQRVYGDNIVETRKPLILKTPYYDYFITPLYQTSLLRKDITRLLKRYNPDFLKKLESKFDKEKKAT